MSTEIVSVRRQWNDWRIASVPMDKLSGIHWSRLSGGVHAAAPRSFLHAYVACDQIDGEIAHTCRHGDGPHRIKVCIVKRDNTKAILQALSAQAKNKPG